ncbi:MAG TPA: hypothetical protein VH165_06990 [Kofleriaceae bacterium]|nr:hypothetical protein [Kofleriaceae bacterium]
MAGIDEPSARSALAAMQDRLARDPTSALGLPANATADDVRAAFLELTKTYHPVRFGRMAIDIQKLSNEVFLALRAAHDTLAKSLRRRSGSMPVVPGSAPPVPGSQAMSPPGHPGAIAAHGPPGVPGSGGYRTPGPPGASGSAAGHAPTLGSPGPRTVSPQPLRPRTPNDSGERPPILPRTITPASGSLKSPSTRPLTGASAPRLPGAQVPARQSGSHAVLTAPPPPAGPQTEAAAIDLLQRQQWDPARSLLHQLQARDPSSKRIRALMCYARGREAQLDRRLDDARVELQDALDLDPDLQLAKTALTELFTRRK